MGFVMASMTINEIDESLKERLCIQAALHGRSMEEEVMEILRSVLSLRNETWKEKSLLKSIRSRVEPIGGIEIEIPARDAMRNPPEL